MSGEAQHECTGTKRRCAVMGESKKLRQKLQEAGYSDPLINAVWPSWWSEDASTSRSSNAELRFSIARKLGLSPESLLEDSVEFAWEDAARFKGLATETDADKSMLTSYGLSIGRALVGLQIAGGSTDPLGANEIRSAILQNRQFVDLESLVTTCWSLGIPVVHLKVFPLSAKRMHAMAVRIGGRYAILLGRDASYPAPVSFTLAHELGHIMLGHLTDQSAIVDMEDGDVINPIDNEETQANEFALRLLVGSAKPEIETNVSGYNAAQLAHAVLSVGPDERVEPGTLALCLAHATGKWAIAQAALSLIYSNPAPVWEYINRVAQDQLGWRRAGGDTAEYLERAMGLSDV